MKHFPHLEQTIYRLTAILTGKNTFNYITSILLYHRSREERLNLMVQNFLGFCSKPQFSMIEQILGNLLCYGFTCLQEERLRFAYNNYFKQAGEKNVFQNLSPLHLWH